MSGPYRYSSGIKRTFHAADYAVTGATLLISALIGVYYAIKDRKKNTPEDYLLGGRKMHVIPVSMSLLSSFISAITIMGVPAEVYTYNTMYWWTSIAMIVAAVGSAHIFIPVFYKLGITSIFEYIEMRFGRVNRMVACSIFMLWMIFYMSFVMYAPSLAINAVTGLSLQGSMLVVSLVCIFYTAIGGMKAVLWADTVQMCFVFAGVICILVQTSLIVGGFDKAWEIASKNNRIVFFELNTDPRHRHTVWNMVVGGGIFTCTVFGTNQAQIQRVLSVSSLSKAKLTVWLNVLGITAITTLSVMVGVAMYAFYATCDPVSFGLVQRNDQLFPLLVMDTLGDLPGLPGLLLSCLFSGSLSTISSGLNAIAAVMLEDYVKPHCCKEMNSRFHTMLSKVSVIVIGLVSLAFAILVAELGTLMLQLVNLLFGVLGGPILGIFTLGMLFPWANKWGALLGILSSLALDSWIVFGTYMHRVSVTLPSPLSTEGCNWNISSNATLAPPSVAAFAASGSTSVYDKYTGVDKIYSISYVWYAGLAVLTNVVVGVIISFLTGPTKPETLNPKLVCPVFDIFFPWLPNKCLHFLRFGVRHERVYEQETLQLTKDRKSVSLELNAQMRYDNIGAEINSQPVKTKLSEVIVSDDEEPPLMQHKYENKCRIRKPSDSQLVTKF
ncbi:hypothetical protein CHS0354_041741 [Potamilus streckersoni]|uniref:Sodium-coupled monocarboxylate transporter 1 n=1 Tax=Potamilus streckersoni TaxID=2493646 RepID=A0AAE0T177_9BIVA|nr:hypothetical protein CHS0354_041741 [Potamilus streckersoni]